LLLGALACLFGVLVAGFWNASVVDGFGRGFVAANTVGDTHSLARTFALHGMAFGVVFAAVAGLAATFTACNCVVFAMLPGLARSGDSSRSRRSALRALLYFATAVVIVGLAYGAFVGTLGASGAARLNAARLPQAEIVFTVLGAVLIVWGLIEFGFLRLLTQHIPVNVRAFISAPTTKAALMGGVVGLFAVGRPFPVFRDLLTYAASSHNPLYGALVMGVQGLGQIALVVVLFLLLTWAARDRLATWATSMSARSTLLTAMALIAGGSYFVYYWGVALTFHMGQWGFRLGIYH
jgi:cytochrome c biogenesis protein CcdA